MTRMHVSPPLPALKPRPISPADKSFPASLWGTEPRALRAPLSEFPTPLVTLDRSALVENTATMADWAASRGVSLAPHGKTTMAPALWRMALDAGAWGLTFATCWQVQIAAAHSISKILMTAPPLDPEFWAWLRGARESGLDFTCWVDSVEAAEIVADLSRGVGEPVPVLVELGGRGGRTGARSLDEAKRVAQIVESAPSLRLAGAGGYEGALAHDRGPESLDRVRAYLGELVQLVEQLDFKERAIVSAGGSAYPDLVAEELQGLVGMADVVLRSGAYQIHDDGFYAGISPLRDRLRSAMHGWSRVLATPEAEFAVLDGGKRDFSFDEGLPILQRRNGVHIEASSILQLNDQHAFLSQPSTVRVRVGDVLRLGLSHPCTVLDKWRLVPVIEDAEVEEPLVVDAIETFF